MKQPLSQRTALLVLCALVVLGFGLRVSPAFGELQEILHTTVPDDAFYYFGVARHITLGDPPSIDGYTPTNGYHPLWMAALVPVYWLIDSKELITPIRVAMLLGAVFDTASALLLWQIARRIGLGVTGIALALVFFLLNPHQVVNATCGLETALALCMLLLAVALYVTARTSEPSTVPKPFRFGLVLGLAVLGRTDQAIFAAALFGASAWALFRSAGPRRALTWGASTAAAAVAVYVPWLAYSLHTTGTIVQSSGVALSFIHRQIPHIWGSGQPGFGLSVERAWASILESAALIFRWFGVSALAAGALAFAGLTYALSGAERRRALFARTRTLAPFLGGMVVLFFAHSVARMVFREWYTAPFIAAAALMIGVFGDLLVTSMRPTLLAYLMLAGAAGTWLWGAALDWGRPLYPYQGLAGSPSNDIREGHSDCGVVSYFTGRGITNLDGIVNSQALEALLRHDLLGYVKSQPFERVYVSPQYHDAALFGRRYREAIVTHEMDDRAFRIAKAPIEKDLRISPAEGDILFGEPIGREYLGDGWAWNREPRPTVISLGEEAELVFYLPRVSSDARLELKLSGIITGPEGFQPVELFLNEAPLTRLKVANEAQFYPVPLRSAVRGRNRLRLRFGHARPRRADALDWWRTLEGNPVLAVEAHAMRFHVGAKQVHSFSVRDDTLACEGCYEREGSAERKWRWTNGRARLTLPGLELEAKQECWLRIVARAPLFTYQVSWNGTPLTGMLGTYRVPVEKLGSAPHAEILIESPVFVPSEHGKGPDTRRLGVELDSIDVSCW
ncbi:MAG TPA: hypothetical protein VI072_25825 [Polyangiaceae bacterium]